MLKINASCSAAELPTLAALVPALAPHVEALKGVRSAINSGHLEYANPKGEVVRVEHSIAVSPE